VEGAVLLKSQPYVAAELFNRLQKTSKLPLLVAADFERGLSMRINGTTVFPHAMAFTATGKTEHAKSSGAFRRLNPERSGALEFFPVADVNSNPANPSSTYVRLEKTEAGGRFRAAYIRGAHEGGMLATAKHFRTRRNRDRLSSWGCGGQGDRARLEAVELPPFKRAIEAGVDAVMVAHVTVPALDAEPNRVATTSKAIVDGLLKEEMDSRECGDRRSRHGGADTAVRKDIGGRRRVVQAGNDVLIFRRISTPAIVRCCKPCAAAKSIGSAWISPCVRFWKQRLLSG